MNVKTGRNFDRYIPRRNSRESANFNLINSSDDDLLNVEFEDEKLGYIYPIFANTAKRANNMISYKKRILGALGITSSSIFKPSPKKDITNDMATSSWPVKSRKRPLIRAPETLLDMPNTEQFENIIVRHMIDWGAKGQIATIFREEVHLWSEKLGQLGQTNTNRTVANCVKWNKSGSGFAVARTPSRVSIIDGSTLKIGRTLTCKCGEGCEISGIAWTNDDDQMIAVCWLGSLSVLDVASGVFKYFHILCRPEIFDIQLSCNDKYFFLMSTEKDKIHVFDRSIAFTFGNSQKAFTYIECPGKCATWHPWRESILLVANKACTVTKFNMNNFSHESAVLRPYFKSSANCILDFITFNPKSAELLASFYYENPKADSINGCNFLTVFSSLHKRVDEVRFHVGSVPYVIWDGTGTKLATIGTDENLAVWKFFGTDSETDQILKKKPKRHPTVFDFQYLVDTCIR